MKLKFIKSAVKILLWIVFGAILLFTFAPILMASFDDPKTLIFPGGFGLFVLLILYFTSRTKLDKVEMESVVFNEQFEVLATDQVEARVVLTTSMFDRLMKLQETIAPDLRMTFQQNHVHLCFSSSNRFEHSAKQEINLESIGKERDSIASLLMLIEELDLNTRIWSKE